MSSELTVDQYIGAQGISVENHETYLEGHVQISPVPQSQNEQTRNLFKINKNNKNIWT